MGETLGREIAAHFSLAAAAADVPREEEQSERGGQGRRSRARHPLTRRCCPQTLFCGAARSGSFHGDLIRPLLVTRTRRQAEQREQTEMDLIIRSRPRE